MPRVGRTGARHLRVLLCTGHDQDNIRAFDLPARHERAKQLENGTSFMLSCLYSSFYALYIARAAPDGERKTRSSKHHFRAERAVRCTAHVQTHLILAPDQLKHIAAGQCWRYARLWTRARSAASKRFRTF